MAGIIFNNNYNQPGSKAFAHYVDYIARDEAVNPFYYDDYVLGYMDNPEKSYGIFTADKDTLTQSQKAEAKNIFVLAQEKGSLLWTPIISFENGWLQKFGVYDYAKDEIDEAKLREYSRAAMQELLQKEDFENAFWTASIHRNTDNIHIHIAMVDPSPSWSIGVGRCRENNRGEKYQRGNFKTKSNEAVKSKFASCVMHDQTENIRINNIIRNQVLKREDDFTFKDNQEFRRNFTELAKKLPDDLRLLKYGNNAMNSFRKDIDDFSAKILDTYYKNEIKELDELISIQEEKYMEAFGKGNNNYRQNKINDLYSRLGNSVLKEIVAYKKFTSSKTKTTAQQRSNYAISAFYAMKQSMKKDIQSIKNQTAYERMIREIDSEIEII